jgi:glycerol kinase
VRDNSTVFGESDPALFGRAIPIAGMAGDQQAAVIGQACFAPGMAKSTYGTGCFMLLNTGEKPVSSDNRMLTTVAYRLGGRTVYAEEGAIFVAGAAIKWLRDGVGVITLRPDLQRDGGASGAGRAGIRGLPDARPRRGDAAGWCRTTEDHPDRWRHVGE